MEFVVFIVLALSVYIAMQWRGKVKFYKMRKGKTLILAEVAEFRDEKSPMRNDYTKIPYPYVRLLSEDGTEKIVKLKYSNSLSTPFTLGDFVEVFWYGGTLYFWNAYDFGLTRYLPVKD